MNNIHPIFRFLADRIKSEGQAVLVTLVAVTGASTRNPGAHMAVGKDGSSVGSFSGGCVETAVVAEALDVMKSGTPREIRFGAGSNYLDIRLPCGGGIDLHFCPLSDLAIAEEIFAMVEDRQPVSISLDRKSTLVSCRSTDEPAGVTCSDDQFTVTHLPAAKISILGHGASVESLARLATSYGIDCEILTPDPDIIARAKSANIPAILLKTPSQSDHQQPDLWTACVFYFHDHDWEPVLMKQALDSRAFYVGAMGSLKTHDIRKQLLQEIGVTEEQMDRMSAPIGLIPSTRDPATLALSTLTEIVEQYHRKFGKDLHPSDL